MHISSEKNYHDQKTSLKATIFELQKWYIPKNECQFTPEEFGYAPLPTKRIPAYAPEMYTNNSYNMIQGNFKV